MKNALLLAAMLTAPLCVPCGALAQNVKLKGAPTASPAEGRNAMLSRAAALGQKAYSLSEAGDHAAALPLLDESLRLLREVLGEEDRLVLVTSDNYAYMLHQAGRTQEGEALFGRTLAVRTKVQGERHPDTIATLNYHAMALIDAGRPAEGAPILARALEWRRAVLGPRHPDTLATLDNYAGVLERLGRFAETEPLLAEVLRIRRETLGETDPETLRSLNNYALVLENLGRAEEAEPLLAEVLRRRRGQSGERDPQTIDSLSNYAFVLSRLGRAAAAEPLHAEALRLNRAVRGERDPKTLIGLNNYANVLSKLGRDDEAEPLYAEALRLNREMLGERDPQTLNSLNNYAYALQRLGRLSEAEPLYAEALRLHREVLGERHPKTLNALNNAANILAALGRNAEAEPQIAEALALRRAVLGPDHPDTLVSLNNHASVLDSLGRLDEAETLYAEGLRLRTAALGPEHPDTLLALNNYAYILRRQGRVEEAAALHGKALALQRKVLGDRHPDTLTSMESRAIALSRLGKHEEALPLVRELVASARQRAETLADEGQRGSAQLGRERAERQSSEGFFADVLWDVMQSASPQGALREEAFTALQLASAGATTQAVADAAAARFASGKGLADLVGERRDLAREWPEVEAALVTAEAGGEGLAADRTRLRNRLAAIDARLGDIDARLAREAPQFFAILRQQSVSLAQLRGQLGADEAVLFIVPGPGGTHSMAVTRDGIDWRRSDLDDGEVASAVGALREGLEIKGGGELPEFSLARAHDLYRELIAPVEDGLAGKRRVYVVADGALSRLPLGVLVTSPPAEGADPNDPAVLRGAAWLADRYALVQLPSLQSLIYIRAFASPSDKGETGAGFIGFGAPELLGRSALRGARSATLAPVDAASLAGTADTALMDPAALRRLAALPGTRIELERVRQAIGADAGSLRLGPAMTESAIRSADLAGVRILHLATHAFTSEEAGSLTEPGLVFTPPAAASAADDGYLAASEVVSLALGSARWVVLSACNTASPSGRPGESGLSGLAQAFFYAGAQSLLVSHWPVFDDIAPVITLEALRTSAAGMPRAEAVQAAQRKVREDPALDAAHPAVWAPFSLVGEGR